MSRWILLITSLPTQNATVRMRIWRALKTSGAAVLRDGVYLLPEIGSCRATLDRLAADVESAGGTASVMEVTPPPKVSFEPLFDRSGDYAALLDEIVQARAEFAPTKGIDALRQVRKLAKSYAAISDMDFFAGEARRQASHALEELESAALALISPDEPRAVHAAITRREQSDFKGRLWATRKRPWVDRLASAWLIRRCIDRKAKFAWIESPAACPRDAVGFDFDGATFSHVRGLVTFEVLSTSFELQSPALTRLGALVHFLDVGGIAPPEASGVESVLAGLRDSIDDDDRLLTAASAVFDGLLAAFEKAEQST